VYGEPVEFPQNEATTPLNSRLPYAVVKNVGEVFFKSYQREFGLDFTIFRFFNTYGPRQSPDFVVSKFIRAALTNSDITLYGTGEQTRTFCYIDDNVEATSLCLLGDHAVNDVINVGNDAETSVAKLARTIIEVTGSSSKIVHLPPLEEGDMTRRLPNVDKMRKVLGRPLTPLHEGIRKILDRGFVV
jgi:UDP-glucose 4-epimerase